MPDCDRKRCTLNGIGKNTGFDFIYPAQKIAQIVSPMDLIRCIQKKFGLLNAIMERAGMSEMDIYNRTRGVFHHYKLPYDAESSEG